MAEDIKQVIATIVGNFIEEGMATKQYANLANTLRQLGYVEAANKVNEISFQEANHAGILAGIIEELMQANCKCNNAPIQDQALQGLFRYAAEHGGKFSLWLFPNPPSLDVNPEVFKAIDAGITKGLSAQEIINAIYKAHS